MEWVIDRLFVLHACFWWNRTIVSTEYAPACEVSDTGTREVELEDKCKEPSKSLSAPRAVKYVTPRHLLELSLSCQHITQCHAANKSLSPWKSSSSKIAAWPRTWNRRAAAVNVNVKESMTTTIQPAHCDCSSQNAQSTGGIQGNISRFLKSVQWEQ